MMPIPPLPVLTALTGTVVAAAIDARTGYIPDAITRPTALAALAFAAVNGSAVWAFSGAAAAGGTLLFLNLLTRGRGLGLGDVKLAVAIGTGLGPLAGITALGAAFVLGGTYATWLLATHRAKRGDAIRFGPFLAGGTFAVALIPAERLAGLLAYAGALA